MACRTSSAFISYSCFNWGKTESLTTYRSFRHANRSAQSRADVARQSFRRARHGHPVAALTSWPDPVHPDPSQSLPGVHFPVAPPLTGKELIEIVRGEGPDDTVNEIVRTLLGWRQDPDTGAWDNSLVPAEWTKDYPDAPPDFIGKADDYSPETDRPVKNAVQKLTRSIPADYKQISREILPHMGFTGWKVNELTPNRTRRATAVNWILYYMRVHFPEHKWSS